MRKYKLKLKLWQKLFLLLLTATVILFNGAMFAVVNLNYSQQMKREKNRSAAEEAFVSTSLYKDMVEMSEGNSINYEAVSQNFEVYRKYYESQGIYLELWRNNSIYSEDIFALSERRELETEDGIQNLIMRNIGGKSYLFVASQLNDPYSDYKVVLSYSLNEITELRQRMIQITIGIDLILMGTVMIVIYLIVRKMMKPLELLSDASRKIAAGDYEKKIQIPGEDELAELANQFNRMSDSIFEKIRQLEEENETKKHLIDNMAHELRTPLTAIQGYAEYIKLAKVSDEEKIEVLDYVIGQVKRLENLSNTLLTLASLREEAPEYTMIDTRELIHTLQLLFKEKAESLQLKIQYTNEIQSLSGNREMILMLLVNLIENASRACEKEGNIEVRFIIRDNHVVLSVEDNGIGMEASELEKISQPFYRVDKARSRKHGGVGLGVTLCQQIANYHNAKLKYESELGKGTKVSVIFTT